MFNKILLGFPEVPSVIAIVFFSSSSSVDTASLVPKSKTQKNDGK